MSFKYYTFSKFTCLLYLLLIDTNDSAPSNYVSLQRRTFYEFFVQHSKDDLTNRLTLYGTTTPWDNIAKCFSTWTDQQISSTTAKSYEIPPDVQVQNNDSHKKNVKIEINEHVLSQIFSDDSTTEENTTDEVTTESTMTDIDFTTDYTTTAENSTNDDDYRTGGLAAQHAFITLVGG